MGQAPSLNRGLVEARGEYVARIDADDRMLPTRLERQVAVLDAAPKVALVGTWIDVIDEHGRLWATIRGDIAIPSICRRDSHRPLSVRPPVAHVSARRRARFRRLRPDSCAGGRQGSLPPPCTRTSRGTGGSPAARPLSPARGSAVPDSARPSTRRRPRGQERFLTDRRPLACALRRLLAEGATRDGSPASSSTSSSTVAERFGFDPAECIELKRLAAV